MKCASFDKITTAFERNALAIQQAKEQGRKVVGQYCLYSPNEIALAAGTIPVSLCGTRNDSIAAAEEILPRAICPLIKSSFGFALKDSCPYLVASDVVVADTTCDGKKKMYELLNEYKPVFLLQFSVDAIVDLTWQGCQTYGIESWSLKKFVQEELKKPFLQIETDYSETDTEQLKVRIEAFIEML